MTESDIKLGHEITGERRHFIIRGKIGSTNYSKCSCGANLFCGDDKNRTFTTPDDAYALEQALVRNKKFGEFQVWLTANKNVNAFTGIYIKLSVEKRCQLIIDAYRENPDWPKGRNDD